MLFKDYDHNKNHKCLIFHLKIEIIHNFTTVYCYLHKNTFLAFKIKYMKCKYYK